MPQKLTPCAGSHTMSRIIANQRLDVKWIDRMWVRGRLGSTALNVAGVARHLALTWTEQPTELDPTYLHKHLVNSSYSSIPKLKVERALTWTHSPQSSRLHTCTNILLLLLINTKVESARRTTTLNTAKQVGIFLSYDDGQMHRTYCILSVPVFLFWIYFQWTYLYLYRTYLYLYRNSWPRGNIQSGCCYWPIWRRFKSCAEVIFELCPFSMCVLFGEDFIPKNCNCTQCTSDHCYWLLSTT